MEAPLRITWGGAVRLLIYGGLVVLAMLALAWWFAGEIAQMWDEIERRRYGW